MKSTKTAPKKHSVEELNRFFKLMSTPINTIVHCSYNTAGDPPCRIKFALDDDDEQTYQQWENFFGYECPVHKEATKISYDLAIICLQEIGIANVDGGDGLDAINLICDRSYSNKKFKKILTEINYFAPILARRRLKRNQN